MIPQYKSSQSRPGLEINVKLRDLRSLGQVQYTTRSMIMSTPYYKATRNGELRSWYPRMSRKKHIKYAESYCGGYYTNLKRSLPVRAVPNQRQCTCSNRVYRFRVRRPFPILGGPAHQTESNPSRHHHQHPTYTPWPCSHRNLNWTCSRVPLPEQPSDQDVDEYDPANQEELVLEQPTPSGVSLLNHSIHDGVRLVATSRGNT